MVDDPLVCELCGRRPAALLTVRRHVGMVIRQRFYTFRGPLCRDHGIQLSKDWLAKTLIQGWWGIISFFVNFHAVATDLGALLKARKMAPPVVSPPLPPVPPPA
jgi:hypothetical protein